MNVARVFSVPIEGLSLAETVSRVETSTSPNWIVTANPEILLEAKRDKTYADVLRQASLRLVDGVGLWLVLRLTGHRATRVTGVELAESLIQQAYRNGWRVGLIGGRPGIATRAAEDIQRSYHGIHILAEEGGRVDRDGTDDDAGAASRQRMIRFVPDILLVAFGHPKQEHWIQRHLPEFPSLKAIVGVGGTFDFWAHAAVRAPSWMRAFGLEWLWRLITEPKRWKRIWNAVVVFPLSAIWDTIHRV